MPVPSVARVKEPCNPAPVDAAILNARTLVLDTGRPRLYCLLAGRDIEQVSLPTDVVRDYCANP